MSKYLILWTLDPARIPIDPRERGKGWEILMDMIKNDREQGILRDWGTFPSEGRGYSIVEGSTLEVMKMTEQYAPFVQFEIHPAASIDEAAKLIRHLAG
jgi:hypothetical protein